jgi:DNA-binding CsgD family transcriptional regulator
MDKWSEEQFICWLAGFFDGEGCIHLPPRGIDVSIASTDRAVIEAIQAHTCIGVINVVTYDRAEWRTKYHWRVRNLPEAGALLRRLRPFLFIKAAQAYLAIQRCDAWDAKRVSLAARNAEIIALAGSGVSHREISRRFGLDARGRTVSYIVRGIIADGSHPRKVVDITEHRRSHETKAVKSAGLGVRTRAALLRT